MNSTGKKFTAVASLAMIAALLSGHATAQVLTLHGNQATQQVTYATTGGTLDPHFPVQVQHAGPERSNVVRALRDAGAVINVGAGCRASTIRRAGVRRRWTRLA